MRPKALLPFSMRLWRQLQTADRRKSIQGPGAAASECHRKHRGDHFGIDDSTEAAIPKCFAPQTRALRALLCADPQSAGWISAGTKRLAIACFFSARRKRLEALGLSAGAPRWRPIRPSRSDKGQPDQLGAELKTARRTAVSGDCACRVGRGDGQGGSTRRWLDRKWFEPADPLEDAGGRAPGPASRG